MHELDIRSSRTVVDWINFFCDVCAEYYTRYPLQIGGTFDQLIKRYTFVCLQVLVRWSKLTKAVLGSANINEVGFSGLNNGFLEVFTSKRKNVLW